MRRELGALTKSGKTLGVWSFYKTYDWHQFQRDLSRWTVPLNMVMCKGEEWEWGSLFPGSGEALPSLLSQQQAIRPGTGPQGKDDILKYSSFFFSCLFFLCCPQKRLILVQLYINTTNWDQLLSFFSHKYKFAFSKQATFSAILSLIIHFFVKNSKHNMPRV